MRITVTLIVQLQYTVSVIFVGLVKIWLWYIGHGVWLSGLQNTIFMIPDDTHPALAAFYLFWTMIIVLQVSDSERTHACHI